MDSKLVLVSGSIATGKTTLVKNLAKRFDKSIYIDTDIIKWFIQKGYVGEVEVENGIGTMEICLRQHLIAIECTCDIAYRFLNEGYNVFICDLVYTEEFDRTYNELFNKIKSPNKHKIVLTTSFKTAKKRSIGNKQGMTDKLMKKFITWFDLKNKKGWTTIDTDNYNLEQVFEKTLKLIE